MTSVEKQWNSYLEFHYPNSIEFKKDPSRSKFLIREVWQDKVLFEMTRNYLDTSRQTEVDLFGFVGLTTLNLNDRKVYVTEGVSDFLTLKGLYPSKNVLGKTKLGFSKLNRHILKELFDEVVLVADNDSTGLTKASDTRKSLVMAGVRTKIHVPCKKDITLDLLSGIKTIERI